MENLPTALRSGLLCKAVVAAPAGDGHYASLAGQPQPRLTVGATEILILFTVAKTRARLFAVGLDFGFKRGVTAVLIRALLLVARKDAKQRIHV